MSTFNLLDSESSKSNLAPYSGWSDLLNNPGMSEKHFYNYSLIE